MAFLKRLIVWTLVALPSGIGIGAVVSAAWGEHAAIDRATAAFNGGIAGAWLGAVGAVAAAVTTRVARDALRRAGGSEALTGAVIVGGLLGVGLGLLMLA